MRVWARDWLADLCAQRAGLAMDDAAIAALDVRLAAMARGEGFGSVDELLVRARDSDDPRLAWRLIEAAAPAPSGFFRDPVTIDHLCAVALPALGRPGHALRIWIAGCGGGQEAYSLAMALAERQPRLETDILATDLSTRRLHQAQAGAYSAYEVQRGLSAHRLVRWFEPKGGEFVVSPQLRAQVRWARFNVLEDATHLGRFDLILCRGLLSALDDPARRRLTATLAAALSPEGRLAVDPGEVPPGDAWRPVPSAPSVFVGAAAGRLAA